jgi:CheY-like chemotaxis protein
MNPKKVLIAEDDEDDKELLHYFLNTRQDIILMPVVENGVELIETLDKITDANELPDFIILDQNMPKRNGLQTLRLLKETHHYARIPVMVYSTYLDQNLVNSCTENGATALMTKPITQEGYHQMIDTFLEAINREVGKSELLQTKL